MAEEDEPRLTNEEELNVQMWQMADESDDCLKTQTHTQQNPIKQANGDCVNTKPRSITIIGHVYTFR